MNVHSVAKVGLSSTAHGYNAIANLSHAVVLLCFVIMLYFLAKAGGSYKVDAPENLESLQDPLHRAGLVVTMSIVILNSLMFVRVLYEKCSCTRRERPPVGDLLDEPLLNYAPPPQNVSTSIRASKASRCMCNGCDRQVAPGRRPNGDPWDTCCRACAIAGDAPVTRSHDPDCDQRWVKFQSQF